VGFTVVVVPALEVTPFLGVLGLEVVPPDVVIMTLSQRRKGGIYYTCKVESSVSLLTFSSVAVEVHNDLRISPDMRGSTIVAVCGVRVAYVTPGQVTTDVSSPTDKTHTGVFGSRLCTFPFTDNSPCNVCDPVHVFPSSTLSAHHCVQRLSLSGPTVTVWPTDGLTYHGKCMWMWIFTIFSDAEH
jgi:hypothetical protein